MNNSPQTLGGSFSSVSKPIFASKYAFFSIFRDLQNSHTFAPLESQVEKNLETTTQKIPTKTEENAAPKCRTEIPEPPKHTLQDERCTVTAHCRSELLEEVRWGCMRNRLHTTNKRLWGNKWLWGSKWRWGDARTDPNNTDRCARRQTPEYKMPLRIPN